MKYTIEISYRTGGSLHSEDATAYLELEWSDLNVAKANLKRIQEHYKMYQELHSYRNPKNNQEIFAENADKDWFVSKTKLGTFKDGKFDHVIEPRNEQMWIERGFEVKPVFDDFYSEQCLNLFTDSGNKMQLSAFWTGYFEQLYGAKIIIGVDEELEFTV